MKLLCIFTVVLAFAAAEESEIPDSLAVASTELLKDSGENLEGSASAYNYVSSDNKNSDSPQTRYYGQSSSYVPPQNSYVPPQNSYVPPQNSYVPPQNSYVPPQNSYVPPQNTYVPPQNTYVPPQNNYVPPQNNYVPPQNTYYPPSNPAPSSTSAPASVIKNELTYGDNGSYQYEYQITDGTWVGEQGYFLNPRTDDESIVKKGWYSFTGADGKVYTVTWWADHTGFHASGDHLPTPPPVPAAIQASIDQQKKEEAEKQQQQNKPTYYPTNTEKPYYPTQPAYYPTQPTYYPAQPTNRPNQQTYYPNQQTYYPNQPAYQNYPSYGKKEAL